MSTAIQTTRPGETESDAEADEAAPLRTAEQVALTRHLDLARVPDEDEDSTVDEYAALAAAEARKVALPKTLKAAHGLLQEILDGDVANQAEDKVKKAKLARVRAHISVLAEGEPTPVLSIVTQKNIFDAQTANANEFKFRGLARSNPEVRAVLDELAALKVKCAALEAAAAAPAEKGAGTETDLSAPKGDRKKPDTK